MSKFSPLLAAKADSSVSLSFPYLASPKIDGIRALVKDGVVLSRSGKPIPNPHVQALFGHLHGFDGELVVGDPTAPDCFRSSQAVMAKKGAPAVHFFVFDWFTGGSLPYIKRLAPHIISEKMGDLGRNVSLVAQHMVYRQSELDEYESECLACGFEGVMLRKPDAPYKFGRSTAKEGYLLKVKRFADAEAEILGGEVQRDASGKEKDVLGALHVRDLTSGVEFAIGAGFTEDERAQFWIGLDTLSGSLVRYRHFPVGAKDKPRFPVFAGLRSALDLEVAHG